MRMSFNTMFNKGVRSGNPLASLGKGSAKWLSILGAILVGIGLLVIKFPMLFITIISTLIFTIAFFVFMFALKCFRMAQKFEQTIHDSPDNGPPNNDGQSERIFVEVNQR